MSRRYNSAIIYIILFAMIIQLFPQSSFAQEESGQEEIEEVVLFAKQPNEEIELFEDRKSDKVLVSIPDDTTVELIETKDQVSFVRYLPDSEGRTEWSGYVNILHIIPSDEAEEFRKLRLKPGFDIEKYQAEKMEEDKESNNNDIETIKQESNDKTIEITLNPKTNEPEEQPEKNSQKLSAPKAISVTSESEVLLRGIALRDETNVYDEDKSKILGTYKKGDILEYRDSDKDWYMTVIPINGKTGFLSKSDVETAVTTQKSQKGVAVKSPVRAYSTASTASKVMKTYEYGTILDYKTFTKGWHEVTVQVNGKAQNGYIQAADIGKLETKLKGYALADPAYVYSRTDRKSAKLKTYKKGSILQFRAHDSNWFQIDVAVKGKNQTGYIHKKDLTDKPPLLTGYALKDSTYVFGSRSKKGSKLKTYKKGSILKYRPYDSNWYTATVKVNGKSKTGYIHKDDVSDKPPLLTGYALKDSTYVFGSMSKSGSKLKTYKKGQSLKYRPYNSNWYTATVKVGGKSQKGYLHKKDVGDKPPVFTGFAKNASTYVYSKPDRKSSKLKTYKKGHQLKYYYHSSSWFKATVVVKGKKRTGYIHVKDVGKATDISFVNPNRVYSYNHMAEDIKKLQKAYPDLIKYKVVGKSEYGRNIYAVSLGKGKPTTFINGSHHAREWLTTNLNMYMVEQYAKAYQKNSKIKGYDVRKILNETTIWFIPMVNPDGVTLQQQGLKAFPKNTHASLIVMNNGSTNFKRWKANGKGVDLNRQYDAGWKTIKGNPGRPSYKNYKGKAPATASEVKAVLKLEAEIRPEIAVAYHSSGKILYWNYKQKSADYRRDHAYAKTIGKMTGYGLVYPGPNPSGGGFTDWFIQKRKRPGFTPEISRYVYETNPPLSEFNGAWRENQAVGLYVAQESAKLYKARNKK
ncbi:peptidase M14 carboxypeptidase A [Bacillus freudenreichii]|nr:peptidase M14 carboxypeptidase A [Bacillus freudenreichii]